MNIMEFLTVAPTPILAVVLIALYKIDRRVLKLETTLQTHWKNNKDKI